MVRRNIDTAHKNLEASIGRIGPSYKAGVEAADWAGPAASSEAQANWVAKISDPVVQARRQSKIRETSNEVWRTAASGKGAARIGEGVRSGLSKYRSEFGPVLSAMNSAAEAAPPKGVDPYANVDSRLKPVIRAARSAAGKE